MHTIYKYLAYLIALLVVVQSAVIVWGVAADIRFGIDNPTTTVTESPFPLGAQIHSIVGMYVIPITALVLVALSLIMKAGRMWAGLVLLAAVVQVALGLGGILVTPFLGLLHGINAFVIVLFALLGAREVSRQTHAPVHGDQAAASLRRPAHH